MDKWVIDDWTLYAVREAAIVLTLYFGYLGVQRIVVDHVVAVQTVSRLSAQVNVLRKELQKVRIALQAQKLAVTK